MLLDLSPSSSPVATSSVAAHNGGSGTAFDLVLTPPLGPVGVMSAVGLHAPSAESLTAQQLIVLSPSAGIGGTVAVGLHASGAAGFIDQDRIVSSPIATNVSSAIVDDLHASGVSGSTDREGIVSSPSATDVRMINMGNLHASGIGLAADLGRPRTTDNRQLLSASPGTVWTCTDSAAAPPSVSAIAPVAGGQSRAVCASPPPLMPALPPAQLEPGLAPSSTVLFSRDGFPALTAAKKARRGGHELSRQDRLLVAERSPAASLGSDLLGPEPGDRGPPPKSRMEDPNEAPAWSLEREIDNLVRVLPDVCKLFLIGGELAI